MIQINTVLLGLRNELAHNDNKNIIETHGKESSHLLLSFKFHLAPPQHEIGCFQLDEDIFPTVLANFHGTLDYENVLETVRSCAKLAFHQNNRYFGLANDGECRVGPDVHANIFKPKTSSDCSSSVGKIGAVYLYTLGK